MASKFQNRLVGTVILVAIGVIVLPGLLDGKKKHYKEEFAAIPLVPKPGDQQDNDLVPPVTKPLPGTPSTAATPAVPSPSTDDADSVSTPPQTQTATGNASPSAADTRPQQQQQLQQQQAAAARQKQAQLAQQRQAERDAQERAQKQQAALAAAEKAKVREAQQAQAREEQERQRALQALNNQKPAPAAAAPAAETPTGQAYVIQLGALKNAAKVTEIVTQLRSAGFRAYSLPAEPVQGQINRILVGPDSSKSRLQSQIGDLKSKTGLSGVVRPYTAR